MISLPVIRSKTGKSLSNIYLHRLDDEFLACGNGVPFPAHEERGIFAYIAASYRPCTSSAIGADVPSFTAAKAGCRYTRKAAQSGVAVGIMQATIRHATRVVS
jgi:hypothetical protein